MTTTPADIDELERIARAATQGEWLLRESDRPDMLDLAKEEYVSQTSGKVVIIADTDLRTIAYIGVTLETVAEDDANAAFMKRFDPPTVLALLSELRTLRDEIGTLKASLGFMDAHTVAAGNLEMADAEIAILRSSLEEKDRVIEAAQALVDTFHSGRPSINAAVVGLKEFNYLSAALAKVKT